MTISSQAYKHSQSPPISSWCWKSISTRLSPSFPRNTCLCPSKSVTVTWILHRTFPFQCFQISVVAMAGVDTVTCWQWFLDMKSAILLLLFIESIQCCLSLQLHFLIQNGKSLCTGFKKRRLDFGSNVSRQWMAVSAEKEDRDWLLASGKQV